MKPMNWSLVISSVVLSVGFVVGSSNIYKGFVEQNVPVSVQQQPQRYDTPNVEPLLLTLEEAARYLNMSEYKLKVIVQNEAYIAEKSIDFIGERFPIIKYDTEIYVSKEGLKDWVKSATGLNKQYYSDPTKHTK
ncbi:helix-turn-helix domain-containing protein [Paenibacillus sp. N1-5-1-14]|uniref:helix-turn-helix domain-containing protein n=1 Tax=Paenibacillus radicibacter TaxID=2972488 RepID=UPI0021595ACB|nr:helix-turn-helix domain-containing protein [Paenibacillus radicibacter]MCR8644405.1 helix-turn-helix domain-containing protein [Paenibacillus radicibacter]